MIISTKLADIISHCHASNILELATKYTGGTFSWHPIDLVMDKDPHAIANYVMQNDLGNIHNNIYGRWVRKFYVLLNVLCVNCVGAHISVSPPLPTHRESNKHCRRGTAMCGNSKKVSVPTSLPSQSSKTFKYSFEVPQNWADIKLLDIAAGNCH